MRMFATRPLRGNMSTRDQHPGEIEADLASLRLPQERKLLLLTLPGPASITCDGPVSKRSTFVMSW
jgi:hypothetical protein